jgi:hypothetical protein
MRRFAVTALPRQLQTMPCVPEIAELNTQPLAIAGARTIKRAAISISQTKGG